MNEAARAVVAATGSSRFILANYWADPKTGVAFQVQVQIPAAATRSLEDLRNLPVGAAQPRPVLLRSIATLKESVTVAQYDRYNMQRLATLTANYEGTDLGRQEIYGEILDPENAGIVKRKWFKNWPANKPTPTLEYVLASYDPATSEKTHNDPTACIVLGIFEQEDAGTACILLDAWDEHLAYPELRRKVREDYKEVVYGADNTFAKGKKADLILMEDKSAGISLIQELQSGGMPVRSYNPGRADKVQRMNIVAPLIAKGRVFIPEDPNIPGEVAPWAKRFIRQVCSFPEAKGHDDYVDALSQALRVLRDAGWLQLDPLPSRDYDHADDIASRKYYNPYAA
jgi:predicted phage terminase large subunit-like protein